MLEITVRRHGGIGNAAKTFQFENDELQAFLTEGTGGAVGTDAAVFNIGGLRALGGVPAYAHGYGSNERMPADGNRQPRDLAAEQAARTQPDPRQIPSDRDTLGIRTPIQETARTKADADARAKAQAQADANERVAQVDNAQANRGPILPPKSEKK